MAVYEKFEDLPVCPDGHPYGWKLAKDLAVRIYQHAQPLVMLSKAKHLVLKRKRTST